MNKNNRDRSWLGLIGLSLVLLVGAEISQPLFAQEDPTPPAQSETAPAEADAAAQQTESEADAAAQQTESDADAPAKSESDAAPADEAPAKEADPKADSPVEEPAPKPADEPPAKEAPESEVPAEDATANQVPADETPAEKPPANDSANVADPAPATDPAAESDPAATTETPATDETTAEGNTEDDPGQTEVEGEPIDPEKALAEAEKEEVSTAEIAETMSTFQMLGIAFGTLALIIVPFYIGSVMGNRLRMPDHGWKIGLILGTITWATVITWLGWPPKLGPDLSGGINFIYEIDPQADSDDLDIDKMINALILRVNPGGVKEVTIRQYGPKQIEIIIPNAGEAERNAIKRQISTAGALQFRIAANFKDHEELIDVAFDNEDNDIFEDGELIGHWSYIDLTQFDLIVDSSDANLAGLIAEARSTPGSAVGERNRVEAYWLELDVSEIPEAQRSNAVLRRTPRGGLEVLLLSQQSSRAGGYVLRSTPQGRPQVLMSIDEHNVTGAMLDAAASSMDEQGRLAVSFTFKNSGTNAFAKLTTENGPDAVGFHRHLGILLDDTLLSAPVLNEPITGGQGQISGNFSEEDIDFLVSILNAGSLPAALNKVPISEQTTSPELGLDTINQGKNAMIISMVVVVLFMLFYYRFSGVLACLALGTNILLLMAMMIAIKAAFTLPGLAGLVLTVGMAVDANVLIFERIREELARGAALRMAIRNGFERATTAIVDSNITSLITAIVLYWIGTDQIKGFAVTLILGIVMSMYTAIFCTRVVFEIFERHRWITKLSMVKIFDNANFDFLGKRTIAIAASLILIGIGLAAMVNRGRNILDIDFVGGSSVTVNFREAQKISDVRDHVDSAVDKLEASIDEVKAEAEKGRPEITAAVKEQFNADPDFAERPESDQQEAIEYEVNRRLSLQYPEIDVVVPVDVSVVGIGDNQKEYKIDTSIIDFNLAQRILSDEFGDQLLRNELKFNFVKDTKVPSATESIPADEPATEEKEPGVSQTPLPGPNEYALADDIQLALLQEDTATDATPADAPAAKQEPAETTAEENPEAAKSEPEEKPTANDSATEETPAADDDAAAEKTSETASPAKTEEKAPGDEPKQTEDAPAEETAVKAINNSAPVETTTALLSFGQPINHDSVADLIEAAMETDTIPSASFSVLSRDPRYTPGSELRLLDWEISVGLSPEITQQLLDHVSTEVSKDPVFPSSSNIGGKVAGDTQELAGYAMFVSLLAIVAYIWFRFSSIMFGLAAVAALVHDVLIMLGMIAISFYIVQFFPYIATPLLLDPFKISLPIVAALLTVVGYSLNDTIVIFDRIREVRGKSPELTADMMNISINQSLSRTILTSCTTLFVVVILYFMGGPGIHGFAFSLVVGVIAGTYSTTFIACPVLDWLTNSERDNKNTAKA